MPFPAYHTRLSPGDIGRYVLLPGDPGRVEAIARHLDGAIEVIWNREFRTFTGKLAGERVSVTSTGIGGPSTAIAVEELAAAGADTLIRTGTAGGIDPSLKAGGLCVATAAVRDGGTSLGYVPPTFPAVADHEVVSALSEACRQSGRPFRAGIVRSSDALFAETAPESMPLPPPDVDVWRRAGVLCAEMECDTLFVVASVRKLRAGALLQIVNAAGGSLAVATAGSVGLEPLIETAVEGLRLLIAADRLL